MRSLPETPSFIAIVLHLPLFLLHSSSFAHPLGLPALYALCPNGSCLPKVERAFLPAALPRFALLLPAPCPRLCPHLRSCSCALIPLSHLQHCNHASLAWGGMQEGRVLQRC